MIRQNFVFQLSQQSCLMSVFLSHSSIKFASTQLYISADVSFFICVSFFSSIPLKIYSSFSNAGLFFLYYLSQQIHIFLLDEKGNSVGVVEVFHGPPHVVHQQRQLLHVRDLQNNRILHKYKICKMLRSKGKEKDGMGKRRTG